MSLPINKFKHQITNNKQIPSASGGPMIQTLMNPTKVKKSIKRHSGKNRNPVILKASGLRLSPE
jgi:hypothetical protein